ncbi:MAG: hypothetical protein ACTSVI_16975 [Promethearchaeota archaeon]
MVSQIQTSQAMRLKQSKTKYVVCPFCNVVYKCNCNKDILVDNEENLVRILINAPCHHKFLAFIDVDGRVRATEKIDFESTVEDTVDSNAIKEHIKELEKVHKELIESNYNEAFAILEQIKKLKRSYDLAEKKIVVRKQKA